MRFIEANINKMKDYLCAGEHFRLLLHQDMKCSACLPGLQNCKGGQQASHAFDLAEIHFVHHRGMWFFWWPPMSTPGQAVLLQFSLFAVVWFFLFLQLPSTWERPSWRKGRPRLFGGWAVAQGFLHLLCPQVWWLQWGGGSKWHAETQNAQISPAGPATSCSQVIAL